MTLGYVRSKHSLMDICTRTGQGKTEKGIVPTRSTLLIHLRLTDPDIC